ncbi:MAG TPA: hypothetical protein VGY58_23165 [Gemmataceae bacterium]|jgi:hypothetical protein|nr:hypothetical protein [Gemmataceae bacterium]
MTKKPLRQSKVCPTLHLPTAPAWQSLPLPARQQATQLLAVMLRAHAGRRRRDVDKEAGHER